MLELENVVKHYHTGTGENVNAIAGVSLTVSRGEMVALLGPSGSGKTTLLLLIAALLDPDAGSIRYRGLDVRGRSENEASHYLRHHVGFIFQHFRLMPRVSAVDNAARKLIIAGIGSREARARAIPWLERVGLGNRLQHTPEKLSGGERQRVAIARALATEPNLILADEPTGNLDTARSREIVQLLSDIAHDRGASVILVTHDSNAAVVADRHLTLCDGQLIGNTAHERAQQAAPHS